jgi:hypothetical protein
MIHFSVDMHSLIIVSVCKPASSAMQMGCVA